jgi:hypothetical protein
MISIMRTPGLVAQLLEYALTSAVSRCEEVRRERELFGVQATWYLEPDMFSELRDVGALHRGIIEPDFCGLRRTTAPTLGELVPVLLLVLGHRLERRPGVVGKPASDLSGEQGVPLERLDLNQMGQIESVHQCELGKVDSRWHGSSGFWCSAP